MILGVPRRARLPLALFVGALAAAPAVASPYLLSVLTVCLFLAYVGQAWNVMMGFAGQLSLGHSLYIGLGAYAAAALYVHGGIGPWLGAPLGVALATLVGGAIGWLGFRFGVRGVYFALLLPGIRRELRPLYIQRGILPAPDVAAQQALDTIEESER